MMPQAGVRRLGKEDLRFEASMEHIVQDLPRLHHEALSPNKQASQEH